MRKLIALTILLTLGMAGNVFAGCPTVVGPTTQLSCVTSVFNDSGATIASGYAVAWDNAGTEFSASGNPYIVESNTADDPWTAGVMATGSCPDQTMCDITYYGFVPIMFLDDSNDAAPVDTHVGITTGTNGHIGGYAAGADTCVLGTLITTLGNDGTDAATGAVWVDISCE